MDITSRTHSTIKINLPRSRVHLPFTYLSAHLPLILNVISFSPHTPPYSTTSNIPRRLQQHQQHEALKKSPHTDTPLLATDCLIRQASNLKGKGEKKRVTSREVCAKRTGERDDSHTVSTPSNEPRSRDFTATVQAGP